MTGAFDSKLRPPDTGGRTDTGVSVSVSVSLSVDERGAGLCRRCGWGKGRRQGQRRKGTGGRLGSASDCGLCVCCFGTPESGANDDCVVWGLRATEQRGRPRDKAR